MRLRTAAAAIDAPPPPVAPPKGDSIDTAAECSTTPLRIDVFRERGVIRRGTFSHLRRVPRLQSREELIRGHQRSSEVIRERSSEVIRGHEWHSKTLACMSFSASAENCRRSCLGAAGAAGASASPAAARLSSSSILSSSASVGDQCSIN